MNGEFLVSTQGVRMPRIVYGTAWKKEKTAELVEKALALGFRGIDTACQPKHYFESGVGDGVAAFLAAKANEVSRADLYLQSKFTSLSGQDPHRIPYDAQAPLGEQIEQSLQVSLGNLKTEYLDCLVLHSPMGSAQETQAAWRAMESLVDRGGVRQLGISNCYDAAYFEDLHRWSRIKPAVLQNRFYAATGYDRELRAFCREYGVVYQSFWTLTANPRVLADGVVRTLASKHRRTTEQVLLRYLTQEDVVPLTGTQSATHMREDLDIFDFELTQSELAAMRKLF